MITGEQILKEADVIFKAVHVKLREEFSVIRGNRPSVEMVQDLRVNVYDQELTVRQLGSLSVIPPRSIQVGVWDKGALGAVAKAIESAHMGLSVRTDENNIIATLSSLGNERREELTRLVKKTSEAARIQVRNRRDDIMKRLKEAEANKEMSEDAVFKAKEKIQKLVEDVNGKIEALVEGKIKELGE
jgi:ribosome recycling factor